MAQIITTAASAVAAVCNIILMILLYRWYGVKKDSGSSSQPEEET